MTDPGAEVTRTEESRAEVSRGEDTGVEQGSRLEQYRKRIKEWASAVRDGAEQHAPPELLSGLAGAAKNVAQYLDGMAERARVKQAKEEAVPEPPEQQAKEAAPEPTEQAETASND